MGIKPGETLVRFFAQVKHRNLDKYNSLPEPLRQRYTPCVHQIFGNTGKDSESRRLLRQQVAEDMYIWFVILPSYRSVREWTRINLWSVFSIINATFMKILKIANWNISRNLPEKSTRETRETFFYQHSGDWQKYYNSKTPLKELLAQASLKAKCYCLNLSRNSLGVMPQCWRNFRLK